MSEMPIFSIIFLSILSGLLILIVAVCLYIGFLREGWDRAELNSRFEAHIDQNRERLAALEARIAEEAKKKKRKAERKAQRDLELGIVRVWVENVEERGDQSIRFLTTETLTRRITVENRGEQDKRLMAEQAYARRATL